MNFIVEENAIYYMDENREKNAEVTFPKLDEHTVEINHTFVSPSLRGTGMAETDAGCGRRNFQTGEEGSAYLLVCKRLVCAS